MKTKVLVTVLVLLFMGSFAFAQNGRYGATSEDSINCVRNLSLYNDYVKQKNYESAYSFWKDAITMCPASSVNLYIHGVTIMKEMIGNTTDQTLREARIDTLLSLYDQRMNLFSNSNFSDLYDRKARDINAYRPEDTKGIREMFVKSVEAGREKTDASTFVLAMQKTIELYKAEQLSAEEVMNFYTTVSGYAEAQVKANPASEKLQTVQHNINTLFIGSGVASCENLIALFTPRFQANPEDKDLIISIVNLLGNNDCISNDLYIQAVEAYNKIDPSPRTTYALAKMNVGKEDYTKAVELYREAIELTSGKDTISQYLVELASVYSQYLNNTQRAVSCARDAISNDPKNGKAYLLLGRIWAAQKCGSDNVETKSVFWVAVDYFQKAKNADPSLTEEANKWINTYSQHFPTQSDAFMLDLLDGETYTVTCGGMTERTIIRTRK